MDDDALREKLFNLLQRTGIKNNVKAKLRAELISLFSKQIKNKQYSDLPQSQKNLVNKVTDQMIAKHLEGQGYEYSRSVFATEAGIEKELPIYVSDFFDIARCLNIFKDLFNGFLFTTCIQIQNLIFK